MPSYIEYWQTLSYSTCQQYKSYKNIVRFRKNLFKHATKNGVTLINSPGDNDYQNFISNIIKPGARRAAEDNGIAFRAKRVRLPKIDIAQAPVVGLPITATFVDNALEQCEERPTQANAGMNEQQPIAQALVLVHTAEQPMEQEQWAEQPMEQTLVLVHTAEQPMADATLVLMVQPEQPMADAVPPRCTNTPILNGANKPLVINGIEFTIDVDPVTMMVNATQMCKAAGKEFANFDTKLGMIRYLNALESNLLKSRFELVQKKRGNQGGTMVHRHVALYLAQKLSPEFAAQVTGWLDELLLTGRVELGNEMNAQQPMADTTQVPMIQPMAQTQVLMQEAYATLVQTQAPISLPHCTNTNGAEIIEFVLKLSNGADFNVPVRRDGYVNVTKICQAAGKRLQHYKDRAENKHFLDRFVVLTRIQASTLFEANEGNCANRGTFAHPDIAIHIAQWCSADFSIQVSRWVRQLMTTGRVELGNEMNVQQLDDAWKRRIEKVEANAAVDMDAERNRCQEIILQRNELEQRILVMEEEKQISEAAKKALTAIKTREDLEAAIQFQANTTAPRIATYKEGDNVLYLARIDGTKFKYGHTKNLVQRFDAHMRPGVYPTFEPVGIFSCNNGVAAEDKVHAYVKKKKIGVDYGTQREIILLDNVDKMQRLIKMMQKCTTFLVSTQPANDNTDVVLRRIDAELEMKRIELLMECKITFEQYLQMK